MLLQGDPFLLSFSQAAISSMLTAPEVGQGLL